MARPDLNSVSDLVTVGIEAPPGYLSIPTDIHRTIWQRFRPPFLPLTKLAAQRYPQTRLSPPMVPAVWHVSRITVDVSLNVYAPLSYYCPSTHPFVPRPRRTLLYVADIFSSVTYDPAYNGVSALHASLKGLQVEYPIVFLLYSHLHAREFVDFPGKIRILGSIWLDNNILYIPCAYPFLSACN